MLHSLTTIGTCSVCGGPVQVPAYWMGVIPPIPTCANCGATEAQHGNVIPMIKKYNRTDKNHLKYNSYTTSST